MRVNFDLFLDWSCIFNIQIPRWFCSSENFQNEVKLCSEVVSRQVYF